MKIKRLFSVLGLGLFAAASAGVGALGLKSEPKEVKADAVTWMSTATVDMSKIISTNDGSVSNIRWHVWGTGIDETYVMHESGCENNYTVMASLTDAQSISGCQFIFTQTGGSFPGEKYSVDISVNINKEGDPDMRVSSLDTWSGDKWEVSAPNLFEAFAWFGGVTKTFDRDPIKQELSVKNIEVNNPSFYVEGRIINGTLSDYTGGLVRSASEDYLTSVGVQYIEPAPGYTYDFFVYNNYSDGGILEVKRHSDPSNVYIYYVLENNTPTTDYIYTWGGSEQFGAWPGTPITSVPGVVEVTNNCVLHFQGNEVLIYKIPVVVGYPVGDFEFKFNNNDTLETAARPISGHNAYWWSGDANSQAGYSIDLLVKSEGFRNAVTASGDFKAYSVCGVSPEDATVIVNDYNSLGTYMCETYIDCTTVYTYKRDGSDGNELVSYRAVIEELGRIANIPVSGGSRYIPTNINNNANVTIIIIISVVSLSLIGFTTLIVIRRRKHQ